MRPRMPSGRAHASVGRSCERPRRATGALAAEGGDVALVARDKTVLEAAREAVSAASERRVIAVSCDTGDQSVRDMVLAVTDGLGGVDILVSAAARRRSRWPAVRRPPRTCPARSAGRARMGRWSLAPAARSPRLRLRRRPGWCPEADSPPPPARQGDGVVHAAAGTQTQPGGRPAAGHATCRSRDPTGHGRPTAAAGVPHTCGTPTGQQSVSTPIRALSAAEASDDISAGDA